jgi:hypothetical protein
MPTFNIYYLIDLLHFSIILCDFLCSRTQSRDFYAQAQLQETSKQIRLKRIMFEVEHLIYNKR